MRAGKTAPAAARPHPGSAPANAVAALALAAVVLLAALFTLQRFTDFDVCWHLRSGEWILGNLRVPGTDPFGEMTASEPWLDVAWGAQAAGAALARLIGLTGLQLVAAALVAATLAVTARGAIRSPAVLFAALLFTLTAWQRFLIRPDLLSLPLTIAALALIDRLTERPQSSIALLGAIAMIWSNVHGSFVLAPVLVAAAAAGALAAGARGTVWRAHLPALAVTALAPLASPYGWRLYGLLAPYGRSLLAAAGAAPAGQGLDVNEWRPTWRLLGTDPIFPTIPFLLLAVLVAASFRGTRLSRSLPRIGSAAALLLLAMTAVRNVLPFAAGTLYLVAAGARDRAAGSAASGAARESDPLSGPAVLRLLAAVAVLAASAWTFQAVLDDSFYVARDVPNSTGVGPLIDIAPEGAAGWLAAHQPVGRVFNNYNSGSWLLYRLHPAVRTYLDARLDTTRLYREVGEALRDPRAFDALVERDGIGTIVLVHPSPETVLLLPALAADARWTMVFRDANSTIHVRSDAPLPAKRGVPLLLPPAVEPAAQRLNARLARFKRSYLPAAELTDAMVSGILGDTGRQAAACRRALARSPGNPKAILMLQQLGEPVP